MSLSEKDIHEYLGGLKRYKLKGVNIIIDGEESIEEDWKKIFSVSQDEDFYTCDYVEDESSGRIKEIHFDKVHCPKI